MGSIVLTRVDSRLIHGQVMTKWVNQVQANKIVVVSDELAADEFMRSIYLMSAPTGVEVVCLSEAQAAESYAADVFGAGNVLLLLPSLKALKNVYDQGVKVDAVQVGLAHGCQDPLGLPGPAHQVPHLLDGAQVLVQLHGFCHVHTSLGCPATSSTAWANASQATHRMFHPVGTRFISHARGK